jgi:hypothetical protein
MANHGLRCGALFVLLTVCAACGAVTPAAPTPAPPAVISTFPAPSVNARVFVSVHSLPRASQFLLNDDGTFTLTYSGGPEYSGRYKETNGVMTFDWDGWSSAGPWGATALLGDKTLTVRFNLIMQLSDFEDDVYTAAR